MEEKGLAISRQYSMEQIQFEANALSKSRYFTDALDLNQSIAKILAGRELGFGPFASMNGIYIIKGKPSIGANMIGSAVKSSGKYDYRVREITDEVCKIEFFQGTESLGISEFTIAQARKAGTQNLDKYPRNMLFARAMSNGEKWYCPDVFNGNVVYVPEEMGAEVDEEGNPIINASFKKMTEPETELKKRVVVVETKTVASDPNVHDQANMLAYGVELHLTPAEIGGALKSAGFTGFDVNRWDEMKDAITNAAKTKAPVGTNGHEPVAA